MKLQLAKSRLDELKREFAATQNTVKEYTVRGELLALQIAPLEAEVAKLESESVAQTTKP